MKPIKQFLPFLLLFGVLFYSCDSINSPNSNEKKPSQLKSLSGESFTSNNQLDETTDISVVRSFENDETTFTYTVTNISTGTSGNPNLENFTLFLPSCAGGLNSYSPDDENGADYDNDTNRITWSNEIQPPTAEPNNYEVYSITYDGNVPASTISASIKQKGGQGVTYTGTVAGPGCSAEETISISGYLFIDANENGTKQPEEGGLAGIEVKLLDGTNNEIETVFTTDLGEYEFTSVAISNDYTISVPEELVDQTYYKIFDYTSSSTRPAPTKYSLQGVNEDQTGINFGYVLDVDEITTDLLSGDINLNTRNSQYWAFQLQHAAVNQRQVQNNPNVDFTRDEMVELLDSVENLLLEEPFQFEGEGLQKIQDALSILRGQKYEDEELSEFMKQLLTAELNVMNNLGAFNIIDGDIVLNNPFNTAILIYSEAIACNALGTCPESIGGSLMSSMMTTGISSAGIQSNSTSGGTKLLSAFNGTGGIGTK